MDLSRREFLGSAAIAALTPSSVKAGWNGCAAGFCNIATSAPVITPTWTHVQGTKKTTDTGTTSALAFSAPVASGNMVLGAVLLTGGTQLISVTDDKSNVYKIIPGGYQFGGTDLSPQGFHSDGPVTNGPQTITITCQSSSLIWLVIDEFSPGVTLSLGASTDGTQNILIWPISGSNVAWPAFTTRTASDLLYAVNFSTGTASAGTGWTDATGSGSQQASMWQQASSAGSQTVLFNDGAGNLDWGVGFGIQAKARDSWEIRQQQLQRSANNTTTGSVTFIETINSGSIVIGSVAVGTAAAGDNNIANITSIVDDKGNTYSLVGSPGIAGRCVFWSGGPLTNSPQTITVTCSITETIVYLLVNEFLPPPGTTVFTTDGTPSYTNTASPGPVTTTTPDLVYGFADNSGSDSYPTTGFSALNGVLMSWNDAYFIQTAAGSISATWHATGGVNSGLAAFKAT